MQNLTNSIVSFRVSVFSVNIFGIQFECANNNNIDFMQINSKNKRNFQLFSNVFFESTENSIASHDQQERQQARERERVCFIGEIRFTFSALCFEIVRGN